MTFFTILRNIGTIIDFFKIASRVASEAVKQKKFPDCADSVLLIEQTRKLLDSGVIDVPGVDEKQISDSLAQIEARMTCKVP